MPKVAVAAMAEPHMAPKTALPAITDMANPPGNWPNHLSMAAKSRSLTPVLPKMVPIKINSGIAVRVNEFREPQAVSAIWLIGWSIYQISPTTAAMPIDQAISSPKARRTSKPIISTMAIRISEPISYSPPVVSLP